MGNGLSILPFGGQDKRKPSGRPRLLPAWDLSIEGADRRGVPQQETVDIPVSLEETEIQDTRDVCDRRGDGYLAVREDRVVW